MLNLLMLDVLPLQSELRLFLLVLDDLTDGLPGGTDALFNGQV